MTSWKLILVCLFFISNKSFAIKSRENVAKTENRQSQNFFPRGESSNPNFKPSPSDDVFTADGNSVQDLATNNKYSSSLKDDLYQQHYFPNKEYSQFDLDQQKIQEQQQILQQQQLQQQQLQQREQEQKREQQQYLQQQQLLQQREQYQSINNYASSPNEVYYNSDEFNPLVQQQYNPSIQQQYASQSQQYEDPSYYSQPSIGPSFSPAVTGQYQFIPPSQNPSQQRPFNRERPTYSLYPPNYQQQYGENTRPIHQSQQNYQADGGNGIMDSVSTFFAGIGQGASELFGLNPRPPISGYRPPDTFSPPQNANVQGQQFYGRPGPNPNPVNQFSKAIEEITRNDDFQCIPKVICQMVGSQRRQPSILGSPIFTSIISAVPSTSAGLVYGRAALLGLTSGELSCSTAYPKCPRNEDDLLYYLNNHRGGFFRFFNGGAAFGEDPNNQYNPSPYTYTSSNYQQQQQQQHQQQHQQHQTRPHPQTQQQPVYQNSPPMNPYQPQYQQPPQQQQQQLTQNLAAFSSIADAINQSGGINLSNLGANADLFGNIASLLGGGGGSNSGSSGGSSILENLSDFLGGGTQTTTTPPPATAGIGGLVGNLLTGIIGNRFSGRKVSKRSISLPENEEWENEKSLEEYKEEEEDKEEKKLSSFKRKLNSTLKKPQIIINNDDDKIEGRIINSKVKIYSNDNSYENDGPTKFTLFSHHDNKNVKFNDNYEQNDASTESVRFENNENNRDQDRDIFRISSFNRKPQQVNFHVESNNFGNQLNRPTQFFPGDSSNTFHREHSTKMIFPDRTGTGNLKFDNREFESFNSNRLGKILNYGNNNRYQPSFSGSDQNNPNQISFGDKLNINSNNYNNNNNDNDNYSKDHFTFNQKPTNTYSSLQQKQQQQSTSFYRPSTNYYQSNRYGNQNYNSQNTPTYYPSNNRYSNSNREDNSSQNVYITNAKGVTEYYINAQGKKVYV